MKIQLKSDRSRASAWSIVLLILAMAASPVRTSAQSVHDGFDPDVDSTVNAIVVQPDGKIVIAGAFNTIGSSTRHKIARLNADGSVDSTFAATVVDNTVFALALQPDGKILLGGAFSQVGAATRDRIARLNADGSVDTTFNAGAGTDVSVLAIAVQNNGSVVFGGTFHSVGSATRHCLARVSAQGVLDAGFDAALPLSCKVSALALQSDGNVVVGGTFTTVLGVARVNLARLTPGGNLDTGFVATGIDGPVAAINVQNTGAVLIGGTFAHIGGAAHSGIGRVLPTGAVDTAFNIQTTDVATIVTQADGQIVAGGTFTSFGGATRNGIARLNADATLDTGYSPDTGSSIIVLALAQEATGKIVLGGGFTIVAGQTRNHIAKINPGGTLDADFAPVLDHEVYSIAQNVAGRILLGGAFTKVGATTRNHMAAFNRDGTLTSFNPNVNNLVYSIDVQTDGKLLIGGVFTMVGTTARHGFARLLSNGDIDPSLASDTNGPALGVLQQVDGKVVVAGVFTTIGGANHVNLARLLANDSVDGSFNADANGTAQALAEQSDGSILVGGNFTTLGGATHMYIGRVTAAGAVDSTFNVVPDGVITNILVQPDGKILICGSFTHIGATAANRIARLNANGSVDTGFVVSMDSIPRSAINSMALRTDGKIVVVGTFSNFAGVNRNRIARLNGDGTLDASFLADSDDDAYAVAIDSDGKIMVGGGFINVQGIARKSFARLSVPEAALQSIQTRPGLVTWFRSGASPEVASAPQLLFSLDGDVYGNVGTMSRVAGGWTYTGYPAPVRAGFFLQTLAPIDGAYENVSNGLTQTTLSVFDDDEILKAGFD